MRVFITGASRGIGLELARQVAARGDHVVAAARKPAGAVGLSELASSLPDRVQVVELDVASDASAARLKDSVTGPLDVLINNAGVVGKSGPLDELDFDDLLTTYSTDALGPLRVTRALLPLLSAGSTKKIVNISTGMASISDNGSGGAWGYRMAKAALNMATKNLALMLRSEAIVCIAVNPGWVKTDMGGRGANMPVEESAKRILGIVASIGIGDTGRFLNYDGETFPW
ncbi:MAG: SDR family oxidoreductase [Myxococcales bacterium]|nr:SDR family oxidoreductase [Myxococcales bacterium]